MSICGKLPSINIAALDMRSGIDFVVPARSWHDAIRHFVHTARRSVLLYRPISRRNTGNAMVTRTGLAQVTGILASTSIAGYYRLAAWEADLCRDIAIRFPDVIAERRIGISLDVDVKSDHSLIIGG